MGQCLVLRMYTFFHSLGGDMYIITEPTRGVRRRVLAAYECLDDRIRFDETRGDAEFIRRLQEGGGSGVGGSNGSRQARCWACLS